MMYKVKETLRDPPKEGLSTEEKFTQNKVYLILMATRIIIIMRIIIKNTRMMNKIRNNLRFKDRNKTRKFPNNRKSVKNNKKFPDNIFVFLVIGFKIIELNTAVSVKDAYINLIIIVFG